MPHSSFVSARRLRLILPVVTSVLFLGGCDAGGSKTADFPDVKKTSIPEPSKTKKQAPLGRVGSESIQPKG
jgi:hypothetical protein